MLHHADMLACCREMVTGKPLPLTGSFELSYGELLNMSRPYVASSWCAAILTYCVHTLHQPCVLPWCTEIVTGKPLPLISSFKLSYCTKRIAQQASSWCAAILQGNGDRGIVTPDQFRQAEALQQSLATAFISMACCGRR